MLVCLVGLLFVVGYCLTHVFRFKRGIAATNVLAALVAVVGTLLFTLGALDPARISANSQLARAFDTDQSISERVRAVTYLNTSKNVYGARALETLNAHGEKLKEAGVSENDDERIVTDAAKKTNDGKSSYEISQFANRQSAIAGLKKTLVYPNKEAPPKGLIEAWAMRTFYRQVRIDEDNSLFWSAPVGPNESMAYVFFTAYKQSNASGAGEIWQNVSGEWVKVGQLSGHCGSYFEELHNAIRQGAAITQKRTGFDVVFRNGEKIVKLTPVGNNCSW
jgi:hypothetical protein